MSFTALLIPVTPTGVLEDVVEPLPRVPLEFSPQHLTVWPERSAHVLVVMTETCMALEMSGIVATPVYPVPAHLIVPSCKTTQVLVPPTETSIAFDIPDMETGVEELVVVPLPSCPA
jgi:hypothetical protein